LVTILGSHFTLENTIQFRGRVSFAADSPVASEDGSRLQFRVSTCPSREPQCPGYYPPFGAYRVTVINANGTSNEAMFTLTSH